MLAVEPRVRVLFVGGGAEEANLKEIAARLSLEDKVRFAGRVPHAEVQRYYDLIDVLVYPRLPMRLTELVTPLKPLEAMAQGRLLAASDVGGHRELIRDWGEIQDPAEDHRFPGATERLQQATFRTPDRRGSQ